MHNTCLMASFSGQAGTMVPERQITFDFNTEAKNDEVAVASFEPHTNHLQLALDHHLKT